MNQKMEVLFISLSNKYTLLKRQKKILMNVLKISPVVGLVLKTFQQERESKIKDS